MSDIVVVYHSGFGHTRRVAEYVAKGANATLLEIDQNGDLPESSWEALDTAKTIVFGTPTYMGNASWQFKKFADATSRIWFNRGWQNKLFAGFTNSASPVGDKGCTMAWLQVLAAQHGGIWISLDLLPSNTKAATKADLNVLGGAAGLLVQSPSDASVDEIPSGDLDTATAYGARIADVTSRFK